MKRESEQAAGHHRYPFGPVKGVSWVSGHCLARFRERAGVTGTAGEVLRRLEQWLEESRLARLKSGRVVPKMFAHGCRAATYYLFGNPSKGMGWVLVVEGGVLSTVHRHDSGEWELVERRRP